MTDIGMIQETLGNAQPGDAPDDPLTAAAVRLGALGRLPHPLHLLEFAAGTQHYHFGSFERPGESLRCAQDRMSAWGAQHFAPGARVLDIGCGLGGTSRLLAGLHCRVTGLDPCREALVYAHELCRQARTNQPPRFVARTLEEHARMAPGAADGAIAIEVLQHFPDLEAFFACCRSLLHPGAVLVVHDIALEARIAPPQVPFHPRADVAAAAASAGFELLERADLSHTILPTLPGLASALEMHRRDLIETFRASRPVEDELGQLLGHMHALQAALERGDLSYQTIALGSDPPRSFPCA